MSGAGARASEMKRESEVLSRCGNCGKECSQCCGNCRKEFFCSVICQKARRNQHKVICFPAKEEIAEGFRYAVRLYGPGSFWVATRDIEEGERIFTDCPLMTGPGVVTVPGQQICLGCHKILKDFVAETDERKCGECGWPLCGDTCPGIERHLKECESLYWMREYKLKFDVLGSVAGGASGGVYEPIRYIRLMALMKDDPIKWESFQHLYVPPIMLNRMILMCTSGDNTFEWSLRSFNSACQVELTKEEMIKLSAAEDFHHTSPYFRREDIAELVIYDKETRMDMSCMGNSLLSRIPISKKMKDPNGIVFVATKPIRKGERLYRPFIVNPNWDGTKRRRESLMTIENTRPICKCARCSDPTEFGTNVSAIKCTKCSSGHLLPLNPLEDNSKWKCNTSGCEGLVLASDVDKVVNKIQKEADVLTSKFLATFSENQFAIDLTLIDPVTKFVVKYEKILNPHHYILLNVQELTLCASTFVIHESMDSKSISPDQPPPPDLSEKIDAHRRIAGIFLHVGSKIFPPLSNISMETHFYVVMSKFFSAQQAVRNKETCDVVLDWLQQGISRRRHVTDFEIKMSKALPLALDGNSGFGSQTMMREAYDNAIELCRLTPNYRGIPDKILEFDQNVCTPGGPTKGSATIEEN